MKTILITGATGLIGNALVNKCLEQGFNVHYLTTRKEKLINEVNLKGFYWNPEDQNIDLNAFNFVDTIINLAGASIAKRWTKTYKKELINSRLDSLSILYKTIKDNQIPVKHFISASAIGYYPSSLTQYYREDFKTNQNSFIISLVKQWEAAANTLKKLKIPTTVVRIGIVLSKDGGALPKMTKPIKLGLGSVLGTGKQWQSWVHIQDLVRLFMFLQKHQLEGVYNAVGPNPITQKALTQEIATYLKKPLWLPNIPSFFVKQLLGEMSQIVLSSQRVSNEKIQDLGFQFQYPNLKLALEKKHKKSSAL